MAHDDDDAAEEELLIKCLCQLLALLSLRELVMFAHFFNLL